MPFGEREDELWGVLKPIFRPRVSGDPNIKYAKHLLNQSGPFRPVPYANPRREDSRAVLGRVVRKSPEVLVKVTGRKKGAEHLGAHLSYIGRNGEIAIETRDGELISDKSEVQQIAQEWSDALYWRQRATVSGVAMVFSMPEGTNPDTVRQAVRAAADRMIGDNHDYVMALHTDTPRPHVHLTVQAEGLDGQRFDPRREDLFNFREAFAEELRTRGVECEATPRWSRGQGRAGTSMALAQMREKIRRGVSRQPTEADLRQAREALQVASGKAQPPVFVTRAKERWDSTRQEYERAADRLDNSKDASDRELAKDLRAFLKDRPSVETVPDRVLKDAQSRLKQMRERGEHPPDRPPRSR
ncbi:relaxase/mobilization nuclease domain-containing protein [Sphingobium chungbukense]|jgi:type IV secretion system T-DNA border endonuclease VirD2|uniref:Relaxase n=1 Tax=Sphingobium chungbukense TaxID=56193 RepID=A0A0M3AL68_9SPHN|nr:relaxase/mobilization nuclease domain-containing protein [Sphingobium chungbukense]KKW90862.1 relaxase [Sphingobium chungbukense]